MSPGPGAQQSIFISYSHADAAFVRGIVRELSGAGVAVSFDDMERLQVGDVLTERLKAAIDRHDYLGVVLSPTAVDSSWVQTELQWALETEQGIGRVKVLPLIAAACDIPPFLQDKMRLDLSTPQSRRVGLLALSNRLGGDAFTVTARLFPLLGSVATESQEGYTQTATIDAIVSAKFPAEVLEPFLDEAVRRSSAHGLIGLALLGMGLVDQSDCCHAATESACRNLAMQDLGVRTLARASRHLQNVQAITWWHDVFIDVFHDDVQYFYFLQRHAGVLMRHHYDTVANYLLHPDRGPANYNVDSILATLLATDRPSPFVQRWIDWLDAGRFDGRGDPADAPPRIHYGCLADGMKISSSVLEPIMTASVNRVANLLKSYSEADFNVGIKHLSGMLERQVPFAGRVPTEILDRVHWNSKSDVIYAMDKAFRLLEQYLEKGDADTERKLNTARYEVERMVTRSDGLT
jgi:TIR domain